MIQAKINQPKHSANTWVEDEIKIEQLNCVLYAQIDAGQIRLSTIAI